MQACIPSISSYSTLYSTSPSHFPVSVPVSVLVPVPVPVPVPVHDPRPVLRLEYSTQCAPVPVSIPVANRGNDFARLELQYRVPT